jgi:hypothetical protein
LRVGKAEGDGEGFARDCVGGEIAQFQSTEVLASEPALQLSASNSANNAVCVMCIAKKKTAESWLNSQLFSRNREYIAV